MTMKNIFFPEELVTEDDLYFVCYMVERVARKIQQRNKYVINKIGKKEIERLLSLANVLHCENPEKIEEEWISEYHLQEGNFDVTDVDQEFTENIPRPTQMGKVYMRLIRDTSEPDEDYATGIFRVYNDSICEIIDDYNASAFYEPSYYIARAYNDGGF